MPVLTSIFKNIPELELDESKKKILLRYMLILLLILVLFFYIFLKPTMAKLFNLIPKMRNLKMEIKVVRDDFLFEDKLKNKLSILQEQMAGYENKLSREKELPMLLENLSNLARKSRVKILGIIPFEKRITKGEGEDKKSIYHEVPIEISAQSSYHDLGSFINKLENDKRFLQISDIKIKSNMSNPKRHDIEFVVYAYTFKGE